MDRVRADVALALYRAASSNRSESQLAVTTIHRDPEREVWTLTRADHLIRALVRCRPDGRELRIELDGSLLWSRLFGTHDPALEDLATEQCQIMQAQGWMSAISSDERGL